VPAPTTPPTPDQRRPDPGELLTLARAVALEAADLVAARRREGVEVAATKSSDVDVVTAADRASEELIRDRLLTARPGDGFVGEEGDATRTGSGVTWVVDPIDGTVNFLYDLPQYAVSIAARVGEEVVAGVVVDVAKGEVYTAARGQGAHLDGRPLRVRDRAPMAERLVATGFSYHRETRRRQAAAVTELIGEVRDIRRMGAAALDLCAVAAGRYDAYVEEGLNDWDLAAGGLVAEEAGARLEVHPGVGGQDCVVCAPEDGFAELLTLVRGSGFLRE
jgi:myo-inositol-1(or 4)-monophosphatase